MKYFIPLIGCLLAAFLTCDAQVVKYRCYASKLNRVDRNGNEIENPDWKKSDILVIVNLDRKKINTYGEVPGNYDLLGNVVTKIGKDNNYYFFYDAIDKDGDKCKIVIKTFAIRNDENCNLVIGVIYPFGKLTLKLRSND